MNLPFRFWILTLALLVVGQAPMQLVAQSEAAAKKRGTVVTKKNGLVVLLESESPLYVAQLEKEKSLAELKHYRKHCFK